MRPWRIRVANWISGHVNHYDTEFPVGAVPAPLTDDWLDATEAKLREGLNDRFVDDACVVMLQLVAEVRRLRETNDYAARFLRSAFVESEDAHVQPEWVDDLLARLA